MFYMVAQFVHDADYQDDQEILHIYDEGQFQLFFKGDIEGTYYTRVSIYECIDGFETFEECRAALQQLARETFGSPYP